MSDPFEIPTHCKAGVVVNEGPNFHLEVQMVPVPEPGEISTAYSVNADNFYLVCVGTCVDTYSCRS